jgi:putative ABC transport system permease protein
MLHDLRFAFRLLAKNPTFALAATLTLALAIGGTTAIFSIVDAVLLRPLPFPDPDRLVWGWGRFPQSDQASISPPDFVDYRARARTVRLAAMTSFGGQWSLSGAGEPERVTGRMVSAGLFDVLGVAPALGRGFAADEEQTEHPRVALISHGLWHRRFGGDPAVVGRRLDLDGRDVTVVGVMPAGVTFPQDTDVWMPIALRNAEAQVRRFHFFRIVGRLDGDSSPARAQAELDTIAAALAAEYPDSNQGWSVRLEPLKEQMVGPLRPALLLLLAAVGCVLLIACANVANLLLARSGARRRELAVRAALGATRGRLAGQLLVESLVLAILGGGAGVLLAVWAIQLLHAMGPRDLVGLRQAAVDGRILAFTIALSVVTGLLFGTAPARDASRLDLREALVSREMSVAAMLLMGAGLLLRSFSELLRVDAGFRAEGVLTATLYLPQARYAEQDRFLAFADGLLEAVRAQPGIESAAITSRLPMAPQGGDTYFTIEGRADPPTGKPTADIRAVTPGYFATMRVPVLRGRDVAPGDRAGAPGVVVVNEPFARAFFPGQAPVGQRLEIDLGRPLRAEIVGVVGGVRQYGLGTEPNPAMYLPIAQTPLAIVNVVARTGADPAAVAGLFRAAVHRLDPALPVEVVALADLVARSAAQPRFRAMLVGAFAAVAILLAAIGVYGVVAGLVTERRREIGIRMALGARIPDVVAMVLREGARLSMVGLAVGVAGALGLSRLMAGLLFGVRPFDLATLAGVTTIMAAVTLAATVVPARRAARVDPSSTLRDE